jgi:hypothetical protein
MNERGKIFSEEAYALGKMLDHASWQKGERRLPRNITPSDMDIPGIPMVFDNDGIMIIGELTRSGGAWGNLRYGQRLLYENLIKGTRHCAVLCHHKVDPEDRRHIDTRHDIVAFHVMVDDFGLIKRGPYEGNELWQSFVFTWMGGEAVDIRRRIIGISAGCKWLNGNGR